MKLSGNRLKMTSGKTRKFKDKEARDKFERFAQAIKHGWKPTRKK